MFPDFSCKKLPNFIVTAINVNTKLQKELDWNLLSTATTGDVELAFELIVQGANVEAEISGGSMSPLLKAALVGHAAMVKLPLEKGADFLHSSKDSHCMMR